MKLLISSLNKAIVGIGESIESGSFPESPDGYSSVPGDRQGV